MIESSKYNTHRFLSWLSNLLNSNHFDRVITVERKATAILRALLDLSPNIKCKWDWQKVLSSEALPYLPKNWLKGERILIFNEMIHLGRSTKNTINAIEVNTPGDDKYIKTAAFVVHKEFKEKGRWRTQDIRNDKEALSPDYALERNVSGELYNIYLERIIELLKNKGALLLDTEHLENTFNFNLPPRRFIDSLRTFGEPVEYEDNVIGGFPGVTIRNPVISDYDKLQSILPPKCDLGVNAPKKIRMVRRGPKEFAFIPIWYPPLPLKSFLNIGWNNAPAYVKPALEKCPNDKLPELSFHLGSLVTGIELIRSIWAGLAPFVGKGIEPNTLRGSVDAGSPFGHLRSLYPLLDFTELEAALGSAVSTYKNKSTSKIVQKKAGWKGFTKTSPEKAAIIVDAKTRKEQCFELLKLVIKEQRRLSVDIDWFEDEDEEDNYQQSNSFSWFDFWQAGEKLGIEESVRSIIMDTAIDNAILKTGLMFAEHNEENCIIRGFEFDNEFAREAFERMAYGAEEVILNE